MHIGIDATALPPRLFGAANYIVNLIQALARVDQVNDYTVFTKPDHIDLFTSLDRFRVIQSSFSTRVQRIAWEQTVLPLLAQRYHLDVLHSPHYTVPLLLPCPSVVTFHDMTFFLYPQVHLLYKRLFFQTIMPISARRATAVIAISNSTCRDIIRVLRVHPTKIHSIAYGIAPFFCPPSETAIASARNKYNLPSEFVVYVGNLEPRKNLPALLRAFSRIVQSGLPHSLVLVGSRGWKDTEIFTTYQSLCLKDRVIFLGFVSQQELPAIYGASRALVYPSFYEGFGLPVLEAMACGTPVITSNVSSMPEVAGDAGVLVDPHSVDELTDAIRRVLTDDELRARLSQNGLNRSKLFTWERTAQETLKVYQSVTGRQSRNV